MNYRAPTDDGNSEQTVQRPVYVSDAHELWMGTFTPEEQTSRALRRATHLELDLTGLPKDSKDFLEP